MKGKDLVLVLVVLVVIAGASWYAFGSSPNKEVEGSPSAAVVRDAHTIVLSKDGFMPSEITIKKGEMLTFVSDAGELFWPASNPHPSHTNYGGFDPKEPIEANAAWSFTFDTLGTWSYHDHLAPYYTGTIHVIE